MKLFWSFFISVSFCLGSLIQSGSVSNKINHSSEFTVLFYNVENLFDVINDKGEGDDEYSKDGVRRWNAKRYDSKLKKIAQAIISANDWTFPDVIALAEIENRSVIDDLCSNTVLKKINYQVVHRESPDHRGIDVVLLYNPERITLNDSAFLEVRISEDYCSRDILYVSLKINQSDFHFFVCHWPSRYGGVSSSENNRILASQILKKKIESLCQQSPNPNIVVMGDFNDEPEDKSIKNLTDGIMLNLMDSIDEGTIKFQNEWYTFDQFWVNKTLMNSASFGLKLEVKVCRLPFLLLDDEKYLGVKPFRTYYGYKYQGGYSDHLPILLKMHFLND